MRVLFVAQYDFRGPTEKQALGFAQELAARGHEVMFSLGGDPATGARESAAGTGGIAIQAHFFAGRRLAQTAVDGAVAFRPDIVHALNPRVPVVAAARDLAAACGATVVVHFEDDEWRPRPLGPRAALRTRTGRVARRALSGLRPGVWWEATPGSLRWVARHAAALDALTPQLADEVARRLGRQCRVILPVTPRVGDAARAQAATVALPASVAARPLAVFTGTLWPVHLDDLLIGMRAVAEVQRRGHSLAWVQSGPVHEQLDAQRLAADAGLAAGTAVFLGALPFASVPSLLERATVLLQPGAPTEFNRLRLPAKLQSYLEAGRPTITYAIGPGELLEDRVEVLKTHTADSTELADRIIEVLDDPGLAARLANGARVAARRLFDRGRNVDDLLDYYERAIAASRGPSRPRR